MLDVDQATFERCFDVKAIYLKGVIA